MKETEKKDLSVVTRQELGSKVHQIMKSAEKTLARLHELDSPVDLLFQGKFSSLGMKWDDCTQPDDLGEQIQQSMTMLTSCFAIDWLCSQFALKENHPFTIHGGDENGPDLSFTTPDRTKVLGEIFAAKDPYNNNKLFHDLKVLATRPQQIGKAKKYIICCSPEPLTKRKLKCAKEQVEITDFKDGKNDAWTDIFYQFAGKTGYQARFHRVTPDNLKLWTEKILPRK